MKKKFLLLCSIAILGRIATAQNDLPGEEVEVIKQFEATLLDTKKLHTKASLPEPKDENVELDYSLHADNIEVQQPVPKIRPLGMRRDKLPPGYNAYIKAGYGIPASPLGEVGFYHQGDNLRFNIHARHHGANFKGLAHQKFGKTGLLLDGKYHSDGNLGVTAAIGYDHHLLHFYGYDHAQDTFSADAVKQVFNNFHLRAGIANDKRLSGDLDYHVQSSAYFLTDNYASKEQGIVLNLGGTKWIGGQHPLKLDVITDFTIFRDTAKQSLNNIYFKPSFTYHGDAFALRAGANIISNDDVFHFLPDVELDLNIVGSSLTAFAGWYGDMYKNNLKNLSDYNPFIVSRFRLRNTVYSKFFGGLRGTVRGAEYSAQIGYKNAQNLALFLNDSVDTKRFAIVYDTVGIFYIEGTAKIGLFKGFDLLGSLSQSFFKPKHEDRAWHLPALESNISGMYRMLEDNLKLKAELYIASGPPYRDEGGRAKNLKPLLDLSFGTEYFFRDQIGVFLDINNLLNNKYQRWNHYPTYGLNVLGGIMARF